MAAAYPALPPSRSAEVRAGYALKIYILTIPFIKNK
jgi:hypothetical protein